MKTEVELVEKAINKGCDLLRSKLLSEAETIAGVIDDHKRRNDTDEVQVTIGGVRLKTEKQVIHASFNGSIKNSIDCSTDSAPVSLEEELPGIED